MNAQTNINKTKSNNLLFIITIAITLIGIILWYMASRSFISDLLATSFSVKSAAIILFGAGLTLGASVISGVYFRKNRRFMYGVALAHSKTIWIHYLEAAAGLIVTVLTILEMLLAYNPVLLFLLVWGATGC